MRLFWLLPLVIAQIFAQTFNDIDVKIWRHIILGLELKENLVYTTDPRMRVILLKIPEVLLVKRCEYSLLIVDTRDYIVVQRSCNKIPHFTSDYRTLLKREDEIGAFFWMKGRPTIIFSAHRLDRYGIEIKRELQHYIEEFE